MQTKTNSDPRPCGVPLDALAAALGSISLPVERKGASLIVRHPGLVSRVDVLRPDLPDLEEHEVKAIVRVRTEVPAMLAKIFFRTGEETAINSLALLGALTVEHGRTYVGSRLTLYEAESEQTWAQLQFPLMIGAIIRNADWIAKSMRGFNCRFDDNDKVSLWREEDFEEVRKQLSELCVCTSSGLGFTAEFGLQEGSVSVVASSRHITALWQMGADKPNPVCGGGLLCVLQMPHQAEDQPQLHRMLAQLNQMEMAPYDQPPHFGAWCSGMMGLNPAYVSFIPNELYERVDGIALNLSCWAIKRARWANAMLASMGHSLKL